MATNWQPKAATEVVERRWSVPVPDGDGLSSFTVAVSGVTKDSQDTEGDDAVVILSAGTAGTVASVTITATTEQGLTLVETFYLPIRATTALGETARDVVTYAYRRARIIGHDEDPEASEMDLGIEDLNTMLTAWAGQGADVGNAVPIEAATALNIPDKFLSAVKYNLTVCIADRVGAEVSPAVVQMARSGLSLVKNANLPADRGRVDYF